MSSIPLARWRSPAPRHTPEFSRKPIPRRNGARARKAMVSASGPPWPARRSIAHWLSVWIPPCTRIPAIPVYADRVPAPHGACGSRHRTHAHRQGRRDVLYVALRQRLRSGLYFEPVVSGTAEHGGPWIRGRHSPTRIRSGRQPCIGILAGYQAKSTPPQIRVNSIRRKPWLARLQPRGPAPEWSPGGPDAALETVPARVRFHRKIPTPPPPVWSAGSVPAVGGSESWRGKTQMAAPRKCRSRHPPKVPGPAPGEAGPGRPETKGPHIRPVPATGIAWRR